MDPLDTFAGNLRRLRDERGLTQERLALEAGLELTDVGRIERREREPGLRVMTKLARGLGVNICELFSGFPMNDESPRQEGEGSSTT